MTKISTAELPLRERKKELIRHAIRESAEKLFEERGYDNVSVIEIANAANVSPKTLFTYFGAKEDLLFTNSWLLDMLLQALEHRAPHTGHARAIAMALDGELQERGNVIEGLTGYRRGPASSGAMRSRLAKMWLDYEDAVAAFLAHEALLDTPTLQIRFHAVELVGLVRSLTWAEALKHADRPHIKVAPEEAVRYWLWQAAALIDGGRIAR
jgi:AcrR family transcriptional regulator